MTPTRHARFYFSDGNAVFLVEDTLFQVHRYYFVRDSPVFQDMFSMPSDEGQSDDKPILLEGTKSGDFESLLKCLYPLIIGKVDYMQAEEWGSVLDLAVKWQLDAIRSLAISHMKSIQTSSPTLALQIAAAARYGISDWYFEAFLKICERGRPLAQYEAEQLGLFETARISAIRQKLHAGRGRSLSIYDPLSDAVTYAQQREEIRNELGIPPTPAAPAASILFVERIPQNTQLPISPSIYV